MTHEEFEKYLLSFPDSWLDFPFGKNTSVYKVSHEKTGKDRIFAIVAKNRQPLRLSLKCDPQLAEHLRQEYETVLPGHYLDKKYWNTVICNGQLTDEEIRDLIRLSYRLVTEAV
jgi:predicted DNA-binding protein (MmcQ/YjbR family)